MRVLPQSVTKKNGRLYGSPVTAKNITGKESSRRSESKGQYMDRDMKKNNKSLASGKNSGVPAKPGKVLLERTVSGFDKAFFVTVLILLAFGCIMVFSASYAYAGTNRGDSYYYISRQLIFTGLGLVIMYLVSLVDYKVIKLCAVPILLVSLALMALVIFGGGQEHKGAARWIAVGGITFQPSELLKFAVICICAEYVSRFHELIGSKKLKTRLFWGFVPYILLMLIVAVLFFLQDHFSGCIITLAIIGCMMIIGGSDIAVIGIVAAVGGAACFVAMNTFLAHSKGRIEVWKNPFAYLREGGWQPVQSLYAIASGGIWGVGFGASKQKQLYLPEPQNDYIFAITIEELGFIGALCIIAVFMFLIYRGVNIALRAPDRFSSLLCAGIIFQVAMQTFLNICVVTNTIPSTGISLPFISYGGTSLLVLMAEMGVVLNISRYSLREIQ